MSREPSQQRTSSRPARSSTLDPTSFNDNQRTTLPVHARSEDLNHSRANHSSRPNSPSTRPKQSSTSGHAEQSASSSSSSALQGPSASNGASQVVGAPNPCSACGKPMQGPFVRALQTVFHLNCFKCLDCGEVVASKFFPIDTPDGKQSPLCERDYFRRLGLICAKCDMALRGSYITACNKKFHVEHFTCSVCPTLFGPQDSYYEHNGDVYCHFHYSTRFATKCAGCNSAILKQFVEINRNSRDECWHPECYMINKFWNVKVASRRPSSTASSITASDALSSMSPPPDSPLPQSFLEEEAQETPSSLREKQSRMEQLVYRIWTVLSAFEESSAACISDMLRQVSNGAYLDAIRMAEKFILHVEVLFATIDDLEYQFSQVRHKGMQHVREARMLCRKTVELFTLLSHTQETGARRMGMTQELLALVTGLAHYLKILIRIALTGALKLERDYATREAISSFLDKLHLLAVQGANPTARRMIRGSNGEVLHPTPGHGNYGTQCVTYGFRSLAPENAGESPFSPSAHRSTENGEGSGAVISSSNPPSDLCAKCGTTVEEDCVRLGTYQRWHSHCVACVACGKSAAVPLPKESKEITTTSSKSGDERDLVSSKEASQASKPSTQRRPPANVGQFVYDPSSLQSTPSFGDVPTRIYCLDHAHQGCKGGFQPVQRLEQYAFLLNVALRRLYLLLRKQGVVPAIIPSAPAPDSSANSPAVRMPADMSDPYRNSSERMKSVYLDRKLSATARVPKRSTIVEGPSSDAVTIGSTSYAQASTTTSSQTQYYAASSSSYPQSAATSQTSATQGQYQQPQRPDPYAQHIPPPSPKQSQPSSQASTPGPALYRPQQQAQITPRAGLKMLEPPERSALPYAAEDNPANIPVPSSPSTASGHHGGSAAYYEDPYAAGQYQQQQLPYPQSQHQLYQPQPQHYQNQQYPQQQQQYQYSQQQQQHHQQQQASSSTYPGQGMAAQRGGPGSSGAASGDGLTLADIPSLMEAAQAREQHRSLPREGSIPYISELSPLELAIVRHCAVLALVKSPLKDSFDLDEILEMVEAKKSTFWNKLFNKGEKAKNVKKKGVFGVPLELLVERDGADSMLGAARVAIRVPSFVDDVISAMRTMDMSVEGIFRKNGNIRRLKDLTEALDRDPSSVDLTQDNPVQLAALLKKFLRDLPDPLMTFKLHRLLIASQSVVQDEEERKRYLHLISLIMPKAHRDTMEVLFVFLKWVASFAHMDAETGSKMDLGNLATVIGPSILYSRGRDALRDETFGSLRVVTSLLENQDEFFLVPQDMLPILQDQEYFVNALELPSKEFLKKVDTYMKVKGQGGRTPGAMTPYMGGGPGQSGVAIGSPAPRFAGSVPATLPSPTMERPPPIGGGGDRSGRPSPNITPHPQQQQQQPGPSSTSNHGHGGNGNGYFAGAVGPSGNDYQHPSGSPSMQHYVPQGLLQQQQQQQQPQQRTPPMANSPDWSQPPPRPNGSSGTPVGSRPTSVAGNPPSRSFNNAGPPSTSYTNTGPLSSSPMDSGLYGAPPANGYHANAALRQR